MKGIDISTWQKRLNYSNLKARGIDFAIIRCGYGRESSQKDNMFEEHYASCKNVGMKVGTYLYSYSTSIENSEKEANNCLRFINGKTFDLPVYYDLEESSIAQYGKNYVTEMAIRFCETIKKARIKATGYMLI